MYGIQLFFTILFSIIGGCVFGGITQTIINNKGYDENWFWWGFFFGWIPLVIAACKPENPAYHRQTPAWVTSNQSAIAEQNEDLLKKGGWRCKCGRINPSYTGTCACGMTKTAMLNPAPAPAQKVSTKQNEKVEETVSTNNFEEIKKYKELLDMGILTEEEFAVKKKELLKL